MRFMKTLMHDIILSNNVAQPYNLAAVHNTDVYGNW